MRVAEHLAKQNPNDADRRRIALRDAHPLSTGGVGASATVLLLSAILSQIAAGGWSLKILCQGLGIGLVALLVANLGRYWYEYYFAAPKKHAEEEAQKLQAVASAAQAKLDARSAPTIHVNFSFGSVLPTFNETNVLHHVFIHEDENGTGPHVLSYEGKTFLQSEDRWAHPATGTEDECQFMKVRVINDSLSALTDLALTFAINFIDVPKQGEASSNSEEQDKGRACTHTVSIDRVGVGDANAHTLYVFNGTERLVTLEPSEATAIYERESTTIKVAHGNLIFSAMMPLTMAREVARVQKNKPSEEPFSPAKLSGRSSPASSASVATEKGLEDDEKSKSKAIDNQIGEFLLEARDHLEALMFSQGTEHATELQKWRTSARNYLRESLGADVAARFDDLQGMPGGGELLSMDIKEAIRWNYVSHMTRLREILDDRKPKNYDSIRRDLAALATEASNYLQDIFDARNGDATMKVSWEKTRFIDWEKRTRTYLKNRLGDDYEARFIDTIGPTAFYGQCSSRLEKLREIIRDLQRK